MCQLPDIQATDIFTTVVNELVDSQSQYSVSYYAALQYILRYHQAMITFIKLVLPELKQQLKERYLHGT